MEERKPDGPKGQIRMSEDFDEEGAEQAGSLPMRRRESLHRSLIARAPGGRARPRHRGRPQLSLYESVATRWEKPAGRGTAEVA